MDECPRPNDEPIVSGYTLLRYLITGTYIGIATVFGMLWHFLYSEQGPKMNFDTLFDWVKCDEDTMDCSDFLGICFSCSCAIFLLTLFLDNTPNTIALSILVTIEMFAALNSISSRQSIFSKSGSPFNNPYLLVAIAISFSLHFLIMYVPILAHIFQIEPITPYEWQHVILFSIPVIILEEIIKLVDRTFGKNKVKVSRSSYFDLKMKRE